MRPSAAASASTACCSFGVDELAGQRGRDVGGELAQVDYAGAHRGTAPLRKRGDSLRGPVGQHPGRGRVRRPGADHDDG